MHFLDLKAQAPVFPNRCLECGKSPTAYYTMRAYAGLDLLFRRIQHCVEAKVPACDKCKERKLRGRFWWLALWAFLVLVVWASNGLVLFLYKERNATLEGLGDGVLCVTLCLSLCVTWWARNRASRWYHRWFSPVWFVSYGLTSRIARYGFRDERTRTEVGVLAKVLDPRVLAVDGGYRNHAAPVPVPFTPVAPKEKPAWWAVAALVGSPALFAYMALDRYHTIEEAERHNRSFSVHPVEHLLYKVGGKEAIAGFWLLVSVACLAGAGVIAWALIKAYVDGRRARAALAGKPR